MTPEQIEAAVTAFVAKASECGLGSLASGGAPGKIVACVEAALAAADAAGWQPIETKSDLAT